MTQTPVPIEMVSLSKALLRMKDKVRVLFAQEQPSQMNDIRWERVSVPVAPLDILAWLQPQDILPKIFWQGRDSSFECAAVGQAYECADDPHQPLSMTLAGVQNRLAQLPSGARLWGGIAFDLSYQDETWRGYGPARFVLPRLEIIREGQEYTMACHVSRTQDQLDDVLNFLEKLRTEDELPDPGRVEDGEVLTMVHVPAHEQWEEEVQRVHELIAEERVRKVVLARKTVLKKDFRAGPFSLLQKIRAAEVPASHYLFVFQWTAASAFLGVSPERLFQRRGTVFACEALAATARRGLNASQDRNLQTMLLNSVKERHEHQIVVDMITRTLAPLCSDLAYEPQPRILTLKTGFHLLTAFQGTCPGPQIDHELIRNLHPTPAVAGTPDRRGAAGDPRPGTILPRLVRRSGRVLGAGRDRILCRDPLRIMAERVPYVIRRCGYRTGICSRVRMA